MQEGGKDCNRSLGLYCLFRTHSIEPISLRGQSGSESLAFLIRAPGLGAFSPKGFGRPLWSARLLDY